jgi:hypothetical protein
MSSVLNVGWRTRRPRFPAGARGVPDRRLCGTRRNASRPAIDSDPTGGSHDGSDYFRQAAPVVELNGLVAGSMQWKPSRGKTHDTDRYAFAAGDQA